jgi:hypothetical protein
MLKESVPKIFRSGTPDPPSVERSSRDNAQRTRSTGPLLEWKSGTKLYP